MTCVLVMVEWDPKEEMGPFSYLKFKLRYWVEVESLPDWVEQAHEKDTRDVRLDTGFEKVYRGESLKYRVVHKTRGRKVPPETTYYVKIRDN